MGEPSELFLPADPGSRPPGIRQAGPGRRGPPVQVAVPVVIAGTALLGVLAGLVWAAIAPRAVFVVVGPGASSVLNPETSAFIAADGWFTLVSVVGGLVSGVLGYLFAVRRHGAVAMVAVLAGAVAAALVADWVGQQPGRAAVSHSLALGRPGTLLNEPLALGGAGVLAFWPLVAGLVACGFEATVLIRERLRDPDTVAEPLGTRSGPPPRP